MKFSTFLLASLLLWPMSTRAQEFEFSPTGCNYSVVFPAQPELYEVQVQLGDGSFAPTLGAELTTATPALLRAECTSLESIGFPFGSDKEASINSWAQERSRDLGLKRVTVAIEQGSLGYVSEIQGVKDASDGQRMWIKILNYFGPDSLLTISVMNRSAQYPSADVREFIASVSLRSAQ